MSKKKFVEYDTKTCIKNNIKVSLIFMGTIIAFWAIYKIGVFLFLLILEDESKSLSSQLSSIGAEAGKTDTGGWAMVMCMGILGIFWMGIIFIFDAMILFIYTIIIPSSIIVFSIILSLSINLYEKFLNNIKSIIGLGICNIIISIILDRSFKGEGIRYLLIVFVAIFLSIAIRYTLIKKK